MRRVVVIGMSGSGKTTVSRAIARTTGLPHIELDGLWHDAGWTNPTEAEFVRRVQAATAGDDWVADGNYGAVRELLWSRATHVVWLDYPRWVGTARAVRRTTGRLITRPELWNGNREQWRTVLSAEHPIRWGWGKHPDYRRRYTAMFADPAYADVVKVRLRSPGDATRWLRSLT